ncbi:hypothetical protein [Granulosicoccus antarcticus]|uniref:Uncharacterized protein n=1 Tax=Granulosicoccus antarcticus IMCC3135 TaxID=1192854 RepID=A0A2Z2P2P9_9GAMM|nr:hypothetical protein [Granulosicoccus antarcticus]ASJ74847.1 hypothetical protein IMCC3135_23890 [Granulosicoccus antarcticus IMCC3135]
MIVNSQTRPVARAPSFSSDSSNESDKPANLAEDRSVIRPVPSSNRGFGDTSALRDSVLSKSLSNESRPSGDLQNDFVEQFSNLATDKEAFHATLQDVFGDNHDTQAGEAIRQQALAGDFSWMPEVRFVDAAVLEGAQGAYDSTNDRILISADLKGTTQGAAVLTEEVGHALDNRLNTSDTAGDEGELFQMLLSGKAPSTEQRQAMLVDNDHGSIVVDGEEVAVEFFSFNPFRPLESILDEIIPDDPVQEFIQEEIIDPVEDFIEDEIIEPIDEHIVQPVIDLGESIIDITVDIFTSPVELGQVAFAGIDDFVSALGDGDWSAAGQAIVDNFVDSFHAANGQLTDTLVMSLHMAVNLVESTAGIIEERPLSQNEIDYLRPIFGNSIDYSEVTVQSGGVKELLNMRANVVGNDIFMSEDDFADGGPGLTDAGLVTLGHEMGHIWQFQTQGPEYIHTALADQENHGSQGVGTGEAYDWLHVADQGVSFSDMGPERQAELASFIGQIIHKSTGQLNGDMANKELRKIFGNDYWMPAETWALVNEAHTILLDG